MDNLNLVNSNDGFDYETLSVPQAAKLMDMSRYQVRLLMDAGKLRSDYASERGRFTRRVWIREYLEFAGGFQNG